MRVSRKDNYDVKPKLILNVLKQNNNFMSLRNLYRRLNIKKEAALTILRQMENIYLDERLKTIEVWLVEDEDW